jgi:hypothetical protein
MSAPQRPFHSLLTLGVGPRLMIAAVAAALLWALMGWALA